MDRPLDAHDPTDNTERGQGLLEYGLVIILVAIVIVAILTVLGPQISNLFSRVTSSMTGL